MSYKECMCSKDPSINPCPNHGMGAGYDPRDQPPPTKNDSIPIWHLVIDDMHGRDHIGRQRYGTPLQANNGRDALVDAYQEALDLVVYLRQAIEERKEREGCKHNQWTALESKSVGEGVVLQQSCVKCGFSRVTA